MTPGVRRDEQCTAWRTVVFPSREPTLRTIQEDLETDTMCRRKAGSNCRFHRRSPSQCEVGQAGAGKAGQDGEALLRSGLRRQLLDRLSDLPGNVGPESR